MQKVGGNGTKLSEFSKNSKEEKMHMEIDKDWNFLHQDFQDDGDGGGLDGGQVMGKK